MQCMSCIDTKEVIMDHGVTMVNISKSGLPASQIFINTLWLQELLAELTERATVITLFRDSATKIASDNQHDLFQEELLWTIFRL